MVRSQINDNEMALENWLMIENRKLTFYYGSLVAKVTTIFFVFCFWKTAKNCINHKRMQKPKMDDGKPNHPWTPQEEYQLWRIDHMANCTRWGKMGEASHISTSLHRSEKKRGEKKRKRMDGQCRKHGQSNSIKTGFDKTNQIPWSSCD